MTPDHALQLLYLQQKEARLDGTPRALDRRRHSRGSEAARHERLTLLGEQRLERERERYRIAEAGQLARGEPTHQRWVPGELPDPSQVAGWSAAG